MARLQSRAPTLTIEVEAYRSGSQLVAGCDEVGRGAWAGPLVAAIVINRFELQHQVLDRIRGVRDSKLLSPKRRAVLAKKIKKTVVGWGIGEVSNREIDQWGLTKAQFIAYERALLKLRPLPDLILVDGRSYRAFPSSAAKIKFKYIPKGDRLCYSIACASIIAKDHRDRLMGRYRSAATYGFDQHVGYGTLLHQARIRQHGLSRLHRRTYIPEKLSLLYSQ